MTQSNNKNLLPDKLKQARKKSLNQINNGSGILKTDTTMENQINSQFLATLSHDLKTPLNSILSSITLLKNKHLDSESHELVEIIDRKGHYLFSMMNNILDYYGILFNQITINHQKFNLQQELEEVEAIFSEKAQVHGLRLSFDIAPTLPQYLIGDATRMKQILIHLLDNAIKFTPSGQINVSTACIEDEAEFLTIRFIVKDTGIGIEEPDKIKIRNMMRSESHLSTLTQSQFGLVLSNKLCNLLGGKMSVESKKGAGSSFSFTVRMGNTPDFKNESPGISRILLAEDNLVNQRLTRVILENLGYEVEVANNGKLAVEKFQTSFFDLILMDIQMPVMDGLEATRKIREIEALQQNKSKVLIVALTANSRLQDKENCKAAGMDDFINKPFNMTKFPLMLQNLHAMNLPSQ